MLEEFVGFLKTEFYGRTIFGKIGVILFLPIGLSILFLIVVTRKLIA